MSETRQYDVIYADPPWSYSFSPTKSRRIENHYPTMSVAEICELEIPAKKNSVCYMWATAPKLREGLEVLEAWGFKYKTHCVWDKQIVGMGHWFRGQHELVLVGTRGKFSPPDRHLRVSSVFSERRGRHSKKPTKFRDLISEWYPEASKIEFFARDRAAGWDAWGNQVHDHDCPRASMSDATLLPCTCDETRQPEAECNGGRPRQR